MLVVGSEVEAATRKLLRRNQNMLILCQVMVSVGSLGLVSSPPLWVRVIALFVVVASSAECGSRSQKRAGMKRFIRELHKGVITVEYTKDPHRCDESCSP